jgi:hypothetical protein
MVASCEILEFFRRFDGGDLVVVALAASVLQGQVGHGECAFFIELRGVRIGIYGEKVRGNVTSESFEVPNGGFTGVGHVAIGTREIDVAVTVVIGLLPMAGIAGLANAFVGVDIYVFINTTGMRIVAGDALNREVFGVVKFFVLLMVLSEATAGVYGGFVAANVTFAAELIGAVEHH